MDISFAGIAPASTTSLGSTLASIIGFFLTLAYQAVDFTPSPNAFLSAPELITKYGYPVETIRVLTADYYNLTIFRIPHGLNNSVATKGPVFIQHGFICSANDWLLNPKGDNLPFLLADQGYDVYLGNARGSYYSAANYNRLNPLFTPYWNFSFHEMGVYDLPAVFDYVLNSTGADELFYVGHSMGTSMFYICMSERPEYNAKIKGMFSLAPSAFGGNVKSPAILVLAPFAYGDILYNVLTALGQGQFIPAQVLSILHQILPYFCSGILSTVCEVVVQIIAGFDPFQFTHKGVSNLVGHTPSNASVRTMSHFLQGVINPNTFRRYDWGNERNQEIYGQSTPPDYPLHLISAPIYLYWGHDDTVADPKDVHLLYTSLPPGTVVEYKMVAYKFWNHVDFTYAREAKKYVYDKIIGNMNRVNAATKNKVKSNITIGGNHTK